MMTHEAAQRGRSARLARGIGFAFALIGMTAVALLPAAAQPPWAGGHGRDSEHRKDHETFHYLLEHRQEIQRKVKLLPNGVETVTESDSEAVARKIREHALAMKRRVEEGRPIHMRDPLFAEIFRHAEQIDMAVDKTENGVRVRETSEDAYVATLIQEHARVVDLFVANGHAEVRQNHPVPPRP